MSFNNDNLDLARNIILEHYENPSHQKKEKEIIGPEYFSASKDSPSCIDNLMAYVKIKNGKINDVKFDGIGCAIATSSTDIMAHQIIDKPVDEAKKIIRNYLDMIDGKDFEKEIIDELVVFENVNKQINRIKCAKVGILAILSAIEKAEHE